MGDDHAMTSEPLGAFEKFLRHNRQRVGLIVNRQDIAVELERGIVEQRLEKAGQNHKTERAIFE